MTNTSMEFNNLSILTMDKWISCLIVIFWLDFLGDVAERTSDTHCACFRLFAESIAPGKTEN